MATLQYDFRVVGLNTVLAAFNRIESRAMESSRKLDRIFGAPRGGGGAGAAARAAGGAAGPQYDAHVRAQRNLWAEQDRARARADRTARQTASRQQRDDNAAFRDSVRRKNKWLDFQNKQYEQEAKAADKHAARQVGIARKMENERIREAKRAAKIRDREAIRSYADARSRAGRRYDAGVGALTSLGSKAAGLLALGGGVAIAAGVRSELQFGKSAAMLAGLSKQAGATGNIRDIQQGITDQARLVGKQTGADRESIVSGMTSFFGVTGNLDIAKELSSFFVDMSQITGSSMEEIGQMAGTSFMQAMASNMSPAEARKTTQDIMRVFAGHAALGSINMADYAKVAPSILTTAGRFGGNYAQTAGLVSAIAQTSPLGAANSAPEAATALARFADSLTDLSKKGGTFEKMGVQAFTKNQQGVDVLRNPVEIIRDILKKTKGGSELELAKFGFNIRARKAITGFQRIYREAGGGDAGMKAVEAHLDRFAKANVSPETQKEVVANLRATPAMQFEAAFNELKSEIGQNLLPALTKLAPAMGRLVTAMEPVINWLGKFVSQAVADPWKTIGDVIKIAVGTSIAKAAIGEAIRAQVIKMLVGNPPGTPGTPGAPGAPTVLPGAPGVPGAPGLLTPGAPLPSIWSIPGWFAFAGSAADMAFPIDSTAEQKKALFRRNRRFSSGMGGVLPLYDDEQKALTEFSDKLSAGASIEDAARALREQVSAPKEAAAKDLAAKQQQAAAKALTEAGNALKDAANAWTGGSVFGLFGLNRSPSPGEASPTSGGR